MPVDVMKHKVLESKMIEFDDLTRLLAGDLAAIRIPNYYPKKLCREISQKLLMHPGRSYFNKASEIGRIGMAHFEIDSTELFEFYHDNAVKHTKELRSVFHPYFSPVDKLRLTLEEVWPAGAGLETLYGKKCAAGICRVIDPAKELLAHNDRLDRDSPDSYQAQSLLGQLSACVYLQVPEKGGELKLWDTEPKDEREYEELKRGRYGVDEVKLGEPSFELKPQEGELLIFNVRKYHGVAPGEGKERINVGVFIGYRGDAAPLSYWS